MPDLDNLLGDEFASYARDSAHPSDIDHLIRRGVVRRRRSHVRVVTSTVLVVAMIVSAGILGFTVGDDHDSRPAPAPAPSPPVKLNDLAPEEIAHHEDAELYSLAVSEDDPDVRASAWHLCANERCRRDRTVVAVTEDGFESTEYVEFERYDAYAQIAAVSDDRFYIKPHRKPFLLSPDGTVTALQPSQETSPLAKNERLVSPELAVSPDGTAHRISTPVDTNGLLAQTSGRLVGFTGGVGPDTEAIWSDDGGETWNQQPLPGRASAIYHVIDSADPDTIAIVEGADGATLLPFVAIHVSHDNGATWDRIPALRAGREIGYLSWAFVGSDGSLFAQLQAWSDDKRFGRSKRTRGPYVSDGLDWSGMSPSGSGLPGDGTDVERRLQSVTQSDDGIRLYISQGTRAYVSSDSGRTWQEAPAR